MKNLQHTLAAFFLLLSFFATQKAHGYATVTPIRIDTALTETNTMLQFSFEITAGDTALLIPEGVFNLTDSITYWLPGAGIMFIDENGNHAHNLAYGALLSSSGDMWSDPSGNDYYVIDEETTEEFVLFVNILTCQELGFEQFYVELAELYVYELDWSYNVQQLGTMTLGGSSYQTPMIRDCTPVLPINGEVIQGVEYVVFPSRVSHPNGIPLYQADFVAQETIHSASLRLKAGGVSIGSWQNSNAFVEVVVGRHYNGASYTMGPLGGTLLSPPDIQLGLLQQGEVVSIETRVVFACSDGLSQTDSLFLVADVLGVELANPSDVQMASLGAGVVIKPFLPIHEQEVQINQVFGSGGLFEPIYSNESVLSVLYNYQKAPLDIADRHLIFALLSPSGEIYVYEEEAEIDTLIEIARINEQIDIGDFYHAVSGAPLASLGENGLWEISLIVFSQTICGSSAASTKSFSVEQHPTTGPRQLGGTGVTATQVGEDIILDGLQKFDASIFNMGGQRIAQRSGTSSRLRLAPGVNLLVIHSGGEVFSTKITNLR